LKMGAYHSNKIFCATVTRPYKMIEGGGIVCYTKLRIYIISYAQETPPLSWYL